MDDLDAKITKVLRDEKNRAILKELGFAPSLPLAVELIDDDKMYNVKTVAALLDLSEVQIRRLCHAGVIESIQINGRKGRHRIYGATIKERILRSINRPAVIKRLFNLDKNT